MPKPNPIPTLATLRSETAANTTTPIYFHKPNEPHGFLGQWYKPAPSTPIHDPVSTHHFVCAEQYMIYHKALTFHDHASAAAVLASADPREHKALGKRIRGFSDHEWDRVKWGVVVQGNMLKFGQGRAPRSDGFVYPPPVLDRGRPKKGQGKDAEEVSLKELLLATGDRELVEAAPRDRVWGVGFEAEEAERVRLTCREKWGKNYLGKALMEVRERIRAEEGVQAHAPGERGGTEEVAAHEVGEQGD